MISFLLNLFRGDVSSRVASEFNHAVAEFDIIRDRFRSLVDMCDERQTGIATEIKTLRSEDAQISEQRQRVQITLTNFDALLGDKVLATGDYVTKD